jgi:hypothetical protein
VKEQRLSDWAAAAAVALVLLLTAWGNAYAMLLAGIVGLIVGLVFFRNTVARGGALAALVGCLLAIGLAIVALFR